MLGEIPPPFPVSPTFREHGAAFAKGPPDNSAILRKQRLRAAANPGQAGALGDYPAELPHRVVSTKGGAGQVGGRGPVNAPIIPAPSGETTTDLLRQIRDLLQRMPQAMSLEWRTKFIMTPREAISFIAPTAFVNVLAGAANAVAVTTQTVQERFTGFLTHVSVATNPVGAANNVVWQLRINGAVHPEFANRVFAVNNLGTPMPFWLELTQARTVQLVAINNNAVPVTCAAVLVGWTEFMSDYKPFGAAPATGIA